MNKQIASDVNWLREQLAKRLEYVLPPPVDYGVVVEASLRERSDVTLADTNVLRIVSRIGTAAAVFGAGTLLATAGIGGAAMAASIGAGLLADQLIRYQTGRDRQSVRREMESTIAQAEFSYAEDVSRKLSEGYDRVLDDLKQQQLLWQRTRLEALRAFKDRPTDSAAALAADAVKTALRLTAQIRASFSL